MNDFKSKLPDFKEITSITSKLLKDLKTSIEEIIKDYKQKRESSQSTHEEKSPKSKPAERKSAASKLKETEVDPTLSPDAPKVRKPRKTKKD